jgi:hypothetical protein
LRTDAVDPHRPCDVLHPLLAEILKGDFEFVAHRVAHHAADADAPGFGEGFEAGRDIDAVVDDDVAEIGLFLAASPH